VKLCLIGDPGPSKSEVVATLQGDDSEAKKDDNLFTVQVDDVIFHAWNFPLQRSEHTAHQFVTTLVYFLFLLRFNICFPCSSFLARVSTFFASNLRTRWRF